MTSASTDTLLTVRVTRKHSEALDICSFELQPPAGQHLPAFTAGAHIEVQLPQGLKRAYSLCNDPAEADRYLLGVLKEPSSRGGSQAMHEAVHEGDVLQISAPRNHFALSEDAPHSLLLAGGIGLTPLLAMAERLHRLGRPFQLHHAVRSRDRAAFAQRLRSSPFAARVQHHVDAEADTRLDIAATLAAAPAGSHLYVCGPKGFMDAVLGTARSSGWPEERLHFEFFGAEVAPRADDGSFEVALQRSGRVIRVAADCSVTRALAEAGVEVPTSCEQGVCGTCLTRVLEGTPDHRDLYLTPEEQAANDQFTPCCSRSLTPRLVLDL